jgi:hypothetical protein
VTPDTQPPKCAKNQIEMDGGDVALRRRMIDQRSDRTPGGPAETTPSTGQSETQLNASPSTFLGDATHNAIDYVSTSDRDDLELFPSEHDVVAKTAPSPPTGGAPSSLEAWAKPTEEPASPAANPPRAAANAGSDKSRTQRRPADLMLEDDRREAQKLTGSAGHHLSGTPATDDADVPQRTMSYVRLAGGVVGASLLIGVISFLATGSLIKRAQVVDSGLATLNTSIELPSETPNPVPPTDSPSPERPPVAAASAGVRHDGNGIARSTPSAERDGRGEPPAFRRPADVMPEPLPEPAPREDATPEVSAGVAASIDNLSGSWIFTNQVERSSKHSFNDLTLGFRMQLVQTGNRVQGYGVKWLENGRPLVSRSRTPITVAGTIDGRSLALTFTERGARRITHGSFEMQLAEDGSLHGRFSSDAARSSGRAQAVRTSQPQ